MKFRKLSKEEKVSYKMILPYALFIMIMVVILFASNIIMSFTTEEGTFTLNNYVQVFQDEIVWESFKNTGIWVLGSVAGQFFMGMLVALLLNQIKRGELLFRSIILILPWATLDIVAGVMWKWMYNDMYGILNEVLMKLGIIDQYISWLATPDMAMIAVIIANVWKGFCLTGMFLLAGLQTIPQQLYEAAEIDGANAFRRFWNITIPQLKPVLLTTLMLGTIWTINYFPLIYTMTGGGPSHGTETVVTYIYRLSFRFMEYNKSAALSNILFLVILGISMLFLRQISKDGDTA